MHRLMNMERYKLRTSKLFLILLAVLFVANAALTAAMLFLMRSLSQITEIDGVAVEGLDNVLDHVNLSEVIANPFVISLLMIIMFVSAVSFLYSDIENGYIKNIAGQLPNRGVLVNAKFIIVAIHNFLFFVCAVLSSILGNAIGSKVVVDDAVPQGIATVLLKWLLSVALTCILIMITTGFRNKTLATVMGVFFATGLMSLVYIGINTAAEKVFKNFKVDISDYMPDSLMASVDVINNEYVMNAIVMSIIFIVLFLTITYIIFRKRDVK